MAAPALAIQGLTAATGALQRSLANANSQLTRTQTSLAGFAKGAEDAIPLLGTLAAQVTQAAAAMAELDRRATALGVSTAELRTFAQTAEAFAGLNFDQSFDALETFAERVGEAYTDTGSEIARTFARLGVDVASSDGSIRHSMDVWRDFVDVIADLSPAERNFETAEFGDVVRDAAVHFALAGDEADKYRAALERVAFLDADLADEAADAHQTFALLGDSWDALTTNATNWVASLPPVLFAIALLTEHIGSLNDLFFDSADEGLSEALSKRTSKLAEIAKLEEREEKDDGRSRAKNARDRRLRKLREEVAVLNAYIAGVTKASDVNANATPDRPRRSRGDRDAEAEVESIITAEKRRVAVLAEVTKELEEQRRLGDNPALIATLENAADRLGPPRAALDIEIEQAELRRETAGLSARETALAAIDHRIKTATSEVEKAKLRTLREEVVLEHEALDDANEKLAVESALASVLAQIAALEGDRRAVLLASLGVTEDQVEANEELADAIERRLAGEVGKEDQTAIEGIRSQIRALVGDERDRRDILLEENDLTQQQLDNNVDMSKEFEKLVAADREMAIFGALNLALAEQTAEADGEDLRIHQLIVALKAKGYKVTKEELEELKKLYGDFDTGESDKEIKDMLKDAARAGLKDGFRQFADGGDLGDIFDEIARRLRDAILNRALDNLSDLLFDKFLPFLGSKLGFGGTKAAGGPVSPGNFYLVGEEGPELFAPRLPGAIIPNGMAFGGGSQTIAPVVHISGTVRSDADIRAIADRAAERSAAAVARAVRSGRLTEAA